MKTSELKSGTKAWCWWLHRTLYFYGKATRRGETVYVFCDIVDERYDFTADMVAGLERRA